MSGKPGTRETSNTAGLARRCVAHKHDGAPCSKSAVIGTTVCAMHGGSAPHVKAAAAQRLVELQPLAIERCREFLTPVSAEDKEKQCPLCGRGMPHSPDLVARVAISVLDRTGLGPQAKLEVNVKDDTAWIEYATEDEAEKLFAIMASCRDRMGGEAIDVEAEVVN